MKDDVIEVFEIVYRLRDRQSQVNKEERKRSNVKARNCLIFCIIIIGSALVGAVINKLYFQNSIVNIISLFFLVIGYFILLLMPFIEAWSNRRSIFAYLKAPLRAMQNELIETTILDSDDFKLLKTKTLDTLSFVKAQLEHHTHMLSKRIHLVIGMIERVGLLPGLLAIAVAQATFKQDSNIVFVLGYSIAGLNVISVAMLAYAYKTDKSITLLNLVIEQKKDNKDSPSG